MTRTPHLRSQQGMTLIELMVGITIGLVLVAGLVALFANSSRSTAELDKSIRQFENGRYAVELLNEDLNHAGFYGDVLSVAGEPIYVVADPCNIAVAGLGWLPPVSPDAATVPAAVTGLTGAQIDALACLPDHKVDTPGIVVRRLDTAEVAPADVATGTAYVQSSRCGKSAATFVIAAADPAASSPFVMENTDCQVSDPPATATSAPMYAPVRRHISRTYYIASCNECGTDTVPTLKRAELIGNQIIVTPLVEGIDDIAFEFGFDTQKVLDITQFDGIPDEYRTGLSGTAGANNNDWKNVVAVRLHLLSRTTEPSAGYTENKTYSLGLAGTRGTFSDGFKRRAYSVTSRLNNVAGSREGS